MSVKQFGGDDEQTGVAMARTLPQPTVDSIALTTVLAALADPVRLALMRGIYSNDGAMDCRDLAETVDVSAPTVSHHWRVLREAGLTTTVVNGRKRNVRIRQDDLETRFPGLLGAVLAPETGAQAGSLSRAGTGPDARTE